MGGRMNATPGISEVEVETHITSIERDGNDSVSSDVNGQDVLDTGDQKTVTAIKCSTASIPAESLEEIWALLTASKLYAFNPESGDYDRLLVNPTTGRLLVDAVVTVDVEVDTESIERGGDDSVTSDLDAQDSLTGGGTDQETVSGIHCTKDTITPEDRAKLFALWTASKLYGENPDGGFDLLQLDAQASLFTTTKGVDTASNGKISVGSGATAVLAANADRRWATMVNDSNEVIYLKLGAGAVLNEGVRLNALGGIYNIGADNLYTGAITAICASGGKNLTYVEG